MKQVKVLIVLLLMTGLQGCITYTYNGKQYSDANQFRAAYNQLQAEDYAKLESLKAPISEKSLRIYFPSDEFFFKATLNEVNLRSNGNFSLEQVKSNELNIHILSDLKNVLELLKKKGIYKKTEVVIYDTRSQPQASSETDILYLWLPEKPGQSAGWYLIGGKTGRQVLAFDRSADTRLGIVESLIDSIKSGAMVNK